MANNLIRELSARQTLKSVDLVVGRKSDFNDLIHCYELDGAGGLTAGWIHGPRFIGKSTLAFQIAERARENNINVVLVIAGATDSLDVVLEEVVRKAEVEVGSCSSGSSSRKKLESIARQRLPLLIVIDEFDRVAMNLDLHAQAFLRRVEQEYSELTFLFLTISPPKILVEDVSDVNSRLLAICNQRRLKLLSKSALRQLHYVIEEESGVALPERSWEDIWKATGGFPVAVLSAYKQLCVDAQGGQAVLAEDVLEAIQFDSRSDIEGLWWDFEPEIRMALAGERQPLDRRGKRRCRAAGLDVDAFPEWLLEIGSELGIHRPMNRVSSNWVEQVDLLNSHLASLDKNLLHKGYGPAFINIRTEAMQYFPLKRTPCTEATLKEAFDYLYKTFFEGPSERGDKRRWMFPDELGEAYQGSRAKPNIIGIISDLRNFHFHNNEGRSSDEKIRERSYRDVAQIFRQYAGEATLNSDSERERFRTAVLADLIKHLSHVESLIIDLPDKDDFD